MIIKKITIEINGKINHAIFECARKNIALFPAKHVGRTDAQLAQRMEAEPNIPAASTFPDRATAESSAARAIAANPQKVEESLSSTNTQTRITHTYTQPVGVSLLRDRNDYVPAYKAIFVLKKDPRAPEGYFLLTGFPEA